MRATLFLSCALLLIISSNSQLFLPKITGGIKKFASDIGLVKTTPQAIVKKEEPSVQPTTPVAKLEPLPTTTKPVEASEKSPPSATQKNVHAYRKPAGVSEDSNIDMATRQKPKDTPTKTNLNGFPPGPGFAKNNVTSVNKEDGTVVFPEDAHSPEAAPVDIPLGQYSPKQPLPTSLDPQVCEKGKAYPPNDPCGKTFDSRVVCSDGATLDENNRCRPNDL